MDKVIIESFLNKFVSLTKKDGFRLSGTTTIITEEHFVLTNPDHPQRTISHDDVEDIMERTGRSEHD